MKIQLNKFKHIINRMSYSELDKKVESFLLNNSFNMYQDMLDNGYVPPKSIESLFNNQLLESIKNKDSYLNSLCLNSSFKVSPDLFVELINNRSKSYISQSIISYFDAIWRNKNIGGEYEYNTYKLNGSIKHLSEIDEKNIAAYEQIDHTFLNSEYQKLLIQEFYKACDNIKNININSNFIKSDNAIKNYEKDSDIAIKLQEPLLLWMMIDIKSFNNTNLNDYLNSFNILSKKSLKKTGTRSDKLIDIVNILNQTAEYMNENIKIAFKDDIDEIITEVKTTYFKENATQKALEQLNKNIQQTFNTKSLPKDSLELLDNIQKSYVVILKDNGFNKEVLNSTDKLINIKLPSIINSYLSMESEYRLTMTNSKGKNSYELLNESLLAIENTLNDNIKLIQQDNLINLTVQNRVLNVK